MKNLEEDRVKNFCGLQIGSFLDKTPKAWSTGEKISWTSKVNNFYPSKDMVKQMSEKIRHGLRGILIKHVD